MQHIIAYKCLKIYETSWANARVKLQSQLHFEFKKILGPKKCRVLNSLNSKKFLGSVITWLVLTWLVLTWPVLILPVLTWPVLTWPVPTWLVMAWLDLTQPVLTRPVLTWPCQTPARHPPDNFHTYDIEIEFELTLLTYKVFSCKDVRSMFLSRSGNGHSSNH